jgi:heme A synthase
MENKHQRMSILKTSTLLFIFCILINTVLMKYNANGIFRDLARLSVIITMLMVVTGIILKVKTHFQKNNSSDVGRK